MESFICVFVTYTNYYRDRNGDPQTKPAIGVHSVWATKDKEYAEQYLANLTKHSHNKFNTTVMEASEISKGGLVKFPTTEFLVVSTPENRVTV